MRKIIEWSVSLGGLGMWLLTRANRIADYFSFTRLPTDVREALMVMSTIPAAVSAIFVIFGSLGLIFLLHDYGLLNASKKIAKSFLLKFNTNSGIGEDKEDALQSNDVLPYVKSNTDLSVIYEEYDAGNDKTELRLRFLPDTDAYEADAVLILCYMYKCIRGVNKIRCTFVDYQINTLLQHAPNAPLRYNPFLQGLVASTMIESRDAAAKAAIKRGYVERVDLASGGSYQLTLYGEKCAKPIANDMIRRA